MKVYLTESDVLNHNKRVVDECRKNKMRVIKESPEEKLLRAVMSGDDGFGTLGDDDGCNGMTIMQKALAMCESPSIAKIAVRILETMGYDRDDDACDVTPDTWKKVRDRAVARSMWRMEPGRGRFVRRDKPSENTTFASESFIMGSNLIGHGGYGRAILREGFDDYMPEDPTDGKPEESEEFSRREAMDEYFGDETTVAQKAMSITGSRYLANILVRMLERMGYERNSPSVNVPERVWDEMAEKAVDAGMEAGGEDVGDEEFGDVDGVPTAESVEFTADVDVVDKPQGMEKPEIKKQETNLEPKRNKRLRSRTRNIQIWDKKKKAFAPEYANTRFNRMKDARDAIDRIGSK